jgi:peptidyl-prolyl cis-trans isomerase B (cyclophilin B)
VSSVRDRQRAAARARLVREMSARAETARRKRLLQARIGMGVAGVLVLAAVVWIVSAVAGGSSKPTAASTASPTPSTCEWVPQTINGTPPPEIKEVGTPPTDVPRAGYQVVTINTNLGVIKIEMNLAKAPCTSANIAYLTGKKYYDGSSCHRLVADIFALQCGDPSGTGSGGPTYRFAEENLPTNKLPAYHEGDVAMARSQQPGTNGSQFFFIWANSTLQGDYSLFGHVIAGLDIIKKVAAAGDDGAFAQGGAGGGHPKLKITFKSVTVGPVTPQSQVSPAPAAPSSGAAATPSVASVLTPTPSKAP